MSEKSYIELAAEISKVKVSELQGAKEYENYVALILPNGQKHIYAKSVLESYAREEKGAINKPAEPAKPDAGAKPKAETRPRSRATKSKKN